MTIAELRQLTPKKLRDELKKSRRERSTTKFHIQTGQSQDTAKLSKLKRKIARIKFLLSNELAA